MLQTLRWDVSVVTPYDFIEQIFVRLPTLDQATVTRLRRHSHTLIALCATGRSALVDGSRVTHTHTRLTALFPGLPRWACTRKGKPIWILLKHETVSGSGISWAMCKSAPRSRQITTPAPHHPTTHFFTGRMPFLLGIVELCAKILQIMRNDFKDYARTFCQLCAPFSIQISINQERK